MSDLAHKDIQLRAQVQVFTLSPCRWYVTLQLALLPGHMGALDVPGVRKAIATDDETRDNPLPQIIIGTAHCEAVPDGPIEGDPAILQCFAAFLDRGQQKAWARPCNMALDKNGQIL